MARLWCLGWMASPTSTPCTPASTTTRCNSTPSTAWRSAGTISAGCRCTWRKTNLAQLLRGRAEGIFVAPFEQGEIGPELFEVACRLGLEGLVSKHRERVYRGGRSPDWIKVKNRKHPAFGRVLDQFG